MSLNRGPTEREMQDLMFARANLAGAVKYLDRVDDGIFRMMLGRESREITMLALTHAESHLSTIRFALERVNLVDVNADVEQAYLERLRSCPQHP